MRIDNKEDYLRMLEGAVQRAAKMILKEKSDKEYIVLHHKDVKKLVDSYLDGKPIRQAYFDDVKLTPYERNIVKTGRIALNNNHMFIYFKDDIKRIKSGDMTMLCKMVRDREKRK